MKHYIIILISALISLPAFSVTIDNDKSSFKWTGKKVTGKHVGNIKIKSSKVNMKKGKVDSAEIVMDLNSITNDDLDSDGMKKKLIGHLKSDDFFNVAKYPTAKLALSNITDKSANGKLTIKGKTHPVKIKFKKDKKAYKGTLKFDRTKFGMTYRSGNFFKALGDKMIYDEVEVAFTVVTK